MPLLVTSGTGANGDGYGLLLAFDRDGTPLGPFSDDDHIAFLKAAPPIWIKSFPSSKRRTTRQESIHSIASGDLQNGGVTAKRFR